MPDTRPRVPMNISFRTTKEKQEAVQKAASYGKTVSEMVQAYFRRLRFKDAD